jgi:prolyl 4-hydroxylase
MTVQPITAALRRWIVDQATAGHPPDVVLDAMKASGWDEDTAIAALESTMREHLGIAADGELPPALAGLAANEPARPVPGARHQRRDALDARGRSRGPASSWRCRCPRVVVLADLLSADECVELIALARSRLARSETVETRTRRERGQPGAHERGHVLRAGRVSRLRAPRAAHRDAARLAARERRGPAGPALRAGNRVPSHYDYFDPSEAGTPAILKRGGQRVGSLVCYLNTPQAGGATVFPDIGLEVAPVQGNGVFFSYDRPHPSTRTLHGGAPVTAGEKWVATRWLREAKFE